MWKEIKDFEGYQVSTEGEVRSVDRLVEYSDGSLRFIKGRILKPRPNEYGYLLVNLHKNGKMATKSVHRLVAETFIPNPNNLPQVNHINEFNKTDNRVDTLEWCDCRYNINFGTRNQRSAEKLRNDTNRSKQVFQYTLDGELIKVWASTAECGRNGYNQGHIAACCRGERKTHKGFIWKYEGESLA